MFRIFIRRPLIGRFLSNDPVGFAEGGPAYFNRYAYTADDPVNMTDPTGRQSTPGLNDPNLWYQLFDSLHADEVAQIQHAELLVMAWERQF